MPDNIEIAHTIEGEGIALVGDLVRDPSDELKCYAFIQIDRDNKGAQRPTNYKLGKISQRFATGGIELQFILVERGQEGLQNNVKSMLIRNFPDIVRNVFSTVGGRGIDIWVEPKKVLSVEEEGALLDKAVKFLQFLRVQLGAFRFTSSENVPTRFACLNVIKLRSPITQNDLQAALVKGGFHVPSED